MIIKPTRTAVKKASEDSLIALPNPGARHPYYYAEKKRTGELVEAILDNDLIHISGGTGSGKTAGIEVVLRQFSNLCKCFGYEDGLKTKVFPIKLSHLQGPDELHDRRAIAADGTTYDEILHTAKSFEEAFALVKKGGYRCVMWFMELGRVHPSIQNEILHWMQDQVRNKDAEVIGHGGDLCYICDSNYAAQHDHGDYVGLTAMDGALAGRITANILFDYYTKIQEREILFQLISEVPERDDIVTVLLDFAHELRERKLEGEFSSLAFPNMRQYLKFVEKINQGRDLETTFRLIFYGNGSSQDRADASALLKKSLFGQEFKFNHLRQIL